jgi:hypothetical protein
VRTQDTTIKEYFIKMLNITNTKQRTFNLEYDVIEIHHNPNIKNRPYLIRVFNYNSVDPDEIRIDENELKNLYSILKENKLL